MSLTSFNRPFSSVWNVDFVPDLDCYEVQGGVRVRGDLPGVKKQVSSLKYSHDKDLNVEFQNGNLIVSGSRSRDTQGNLVPLVSERNYGRFSRSVYLPAGCHVDQIKAEFNDGVLDLFVPREAHHEAKKIELQ